MALPTAPEWDNEETCIWFEIAFKAHTILCRIDALCLVNTFGSTSLSESAARTAMKAHWPRIHSMAMASAEAGNLEAAPNRRRRFVRIADKSLSQRRAVAPAAE